MGATFLNGDHYLVDATGSLVKIKENDGLTEFFANRRRQM